MTEGKDEKRMLIAIDAKIRGPLQKLAEQEDRTVTSLARHLLRQAVEGRLKAAKAAPAA